jgi:uncharacterized protein (TIGR00255 family)
MSPNTEKNRGTLRSMTGFGRAEGVVGSSHFTIEVKSVNHRYLDLRFRLPAALSLFEIPLAEVVRGTFDRGAFDISLKHKLPTATTAMAGGTRFVLDETAAKSFFEACDWLHRHYQTPAVPSLEVLAQTNRIFVPVEESQDSGTLLTELKTLLGAALADLNTMREAEGKRLRVILQEGLSELVKVADQIAAVAPEHPKKIQEKLQARVAQWKLAAPVDSQRLEWEIAFFAERSDITEEIDRLRTHTREFQSMLDSGKAVGRKLDFLTQELHREVNTMGSKAPMVEITRLTVQAKTLIEKLREQVQNVE